MDRQCSHLDGNFKCLDPKNQKKVSSCPARNLNTPGVSYCSDPHPHIHTLGTLSQYEMSTFYPSIFLILFFIAGNAHTALFKHGERQIHSRSGGQLTPPHAGI